MSRDLVDRLQGLPPELPDVPDRVQRVRRLARRRRRTQVIAVAAATAVVVAVPAALAVTLSGGAAPHPRPAARVPSVNAAIAARCSTGAFTVSLLGSHDKPLHTAAQAGSVATRVWGGSAPRRVFPAVVRNPIAQKVGLGAPGLPRLTWVMYAVTTVPRERPGSGPGSRPGAFAGPLPGTRVAQAELVDDATLKPAGLIGCAPISATEGNIGFGIADGTRVAATGTIVTAGAGYLLCRTGGGSDWTESCLDQLALAGDSATLARLVGQSRDVSGTWHQDTMVVSSIEPARDPLPGPEWTTPPCPKPAGGWARVAPSKTPNVDETFFDHYLHAAHQGAITSIVIYRPARLTPVLTLASTDPTATRAALQNAYPRALCVIRSAFTSAQVRAANRAGRAAIDDHMRLGVYSVGPGTNAEGQPTEDIEAVVDSPQLRQALAAVPAGMLRIYPWLRRLS